MFAAQKIQKLPLAARGFTLVELLVALGLVALLMVLFAEVFTIATGTMSTQRGIMENDQKARTAETVIRSDLKNLAMKSVMPYLPNENSNNDYAVSGYFSFANRQGFLSISENEPSNDADDVLHCMVLLSSADEPFYGRALPLTNLTADPNQPDADDGVVASISTWVASQVYQVGSYVASTSTTYPILNKTVYLCITAGTSGGTEPSWPTNLGGTVTDGSVTWVATTYSNQTATSHMAEVVYFVRNGNLYRRVMLLREAPTTQPLNAGYNFFDYTQSAPRYLQDNLSASPPIDYNFWRDFDFSARANIDSSTGAPDGHGAVFNDLNSVMKPPNRFGHNPVSKTGHGNPSYGSFPGSVGNPREFVGQLYIGRFTQQETSHRDFNYPHSPSAYGSAGVRVPTDPVDTPDTTLLSDIIPTPNGILDEYESKGNGVVDAFEQGGYQQSPRRGEDILLGNVHGFDVKVWDEIIGNYVDIGHNLTNTITGIPGDFYQDAVNPSSSNSRNLRPTYGPVLMDPSATPPVANRVFDTWHRDFDADWSSQQINYTGADSYDLPPFVPRYDYRPNPTPPGYVWAANTTYVLGSIVIPSTPNGFAYQATAMTVSAVSATSGTSGATEPTWPTTVGVTTIPSDNEITWTAIPNIKRLKSLKITVRYLDVTSDQMRQVTLIQSLID